MAAARLIPAHSSFLAELSHADLTRLRAAVRAHHMRGWKREFMTDRECDMIIESIGRETYQRWLRASVNARLTDAGYGSRN